MTHLDPKRPASSQELRKFGLLVGGVFALIAIWTFYRDKPTIVPGIFGTLGGLLILFGLAVPTALAKVYAGWMGFAVLLSKVTTPIFMGIIYFLVITPMGLVRRAAGRNKLKSVGSSVWFARAPGERRGDLERQF